MRDFFDILGVSTDAPAQEIRRACARRAWKGHPDFDGVRDPSPSPDASDPAKQIAELTDVAIDFVDMSAIADRMQAAFFSTAR